MIKKWNNFILESVSEDKLSDLKNKSENFIGENEMNELLNDSTLHNIVSDVLKYAEHRYDDTSKEIATWYKELFNEFEGWVGSEWRNKLRTKRYGDKAHFISKVVDFYNKVKDEFEVSEGGYNYPRISELSKDIEDIATGSLDELEFYEVFENYTNVVIRIGVGDDIDVYKLDVMANELIPMCKRIEETLNLKNNGIDFDTDNNNQLSEIILGFIYL